jgi:hypothetical protein
MDRTPELFEVIDQIAKSQLDSAFVSMPARIESYDAAKQKAVVQPLVKFSHEDEGGERVIELLPAIDSVPVVFLGSGFGSFTAPISRGDTVLLIFTSCSLDRWLQRGGEVDPDDDRRGDLTDAIAIPNLRPFSNPISPAPPNDRLRMGNASVAVEVTSTEALIGGGSGHQSTILADTYVSAESTMLTALSLLVSLLANAHGVSGTYPEPAVAAQAATTVTAIGNFLAASASYKTLLAKVK